MPILLPLAQNSLPCLLYLPLSIIIPNSSLIPSRGGHSWIDAPFTAHAHIVIYAEHNCLSSLPPSPTPALQVERSDPDICKHLQEWVIIYAGVLTVKSTLSGLGIKQCSAVELITLFPCLEPRNGEPVSIGQNQFLSLAYKVLIDPGLALVCSLTVPARVYGLISAPQPSLQAFTYVSPLACSVFPFCSSRD